MTSFADTISDLAYLNRMVDCASEVHSLPESAADDDAQVDVFGPLWDRPVCDCKLYPYQHGGCPGAASQRLPRGWKSGDDLA